MWSRQWELQPLFYWLHCGAGLPKDSPKRTFGVTVGHFAHEFPITCMTTENQTRILNNKKTQKDNWNTINWRWWKMKTHTHTFKNPRTRNGTERSLVQHLDKCTRLDIWSPSGDIKTTNRRALAKLSHIIQYGGIRLTKARTNTANPSTITRRNKSSSWIVHLWSEVHTATMPSDLRQALHLTSSSYAQSVHNKNTHKYSR